MKYIVWFKRKYSDRWSNEEFATAAEVANALVSGEIQGEEITITRRMALNITDAEDAPVKEPAPVPDPEYIEVDEVAI